MIKFTTWFLPQVYHSSISVIGYQALIIFIELNGLCSRVLEVEQLELRWTSLKKIWIDSKGSAKRTLKNKSLACLVQIQPCLKGTLMFFCRRYLPSFLQCSSNYWHNLCRKHPSYGETRPDLVYHFVQGERVWDSVSRLYLILYAYSQVIKDSSGRSTMHSWFPIKTSVSAGQCDLSERPTFLKRLIAAYNRFVWKVYFIVLLYP